MRDIRQIISVLFAAVILFSPVRLPAQVTTATLYGIVRDSSGAVLPGASVTATHQGTGVSRDIVTDERGEFALPALPTGSYTLKIELPGFKSYTNQGLEFGAGQVVRQAFVLEVGQVAENITVAETAPLVETASSAQAESLGTLEVRELPLSRRSVTNLLNLSAGAFTGGAFRGVRLNGIGDGGTGITVDGTEANSNPEARSLGQYGGNNQIDVMSIESVAEVQVIKGILPAEYGGVAGGQVNMISRSGENAFHGSVFENYQHEALFARDPFFASSVPKPSIRFNQFGGSLGGPILRNRAFFFTTYEGYRENAGVSLQETVPTPSFRQEILAALPFQETRIALDTMPLPNEPINADIGRLRGVGERTRRDNHVVAKGDVRVFTGNLSVTFSRMRPYSLNPSLIQNATRFPNAQDRIATQFVLARPAWVSESRFGWNRTSLDRVNDFWFVQNPNVEPETEIRLNNWRVPLFTVTSLFSTPSSELWSLRGTAYTVDQKLSRVTGRHNVKLGFRWVRQAGSRTNPQNAEFRYLTKADLLANIPNEVALPAGQPPHDSHLDEFGGFVQDDWRVSNKLVLNLGLRYDYYATVKVWPTTDVPAEIVNLEPPTDVRKLDFGALRDPLKPYDPDAVNFGPRVGFAWSLDGNSRTVVRGGVGVLFSPHLPATVRGVSHPFVPSRTWNRTEVASRGFKWPMYGADLREVILREGAGNRVVSSVFDTKLPNPYTIQTMINVQRLVGSTLMVEVGYVHTEGKNFPLQRSFSQAFDRETGRRPNPLLLSGNYVTSEQTMVYDGLQTSLRKRFSNSVGFDFHYTLSDGRAEQGGDLTATYYTDVGNTQDFWNPSADRSPLSQNVRHRITGDLIYEIPWLKDGKGVVSHVLGGWTISSILSLRSGLPLRITQPSGIANSRPDYIGGDLVTATWGDTLQYLNKAAFALVPVYPVTRATIRPGTSNPSQVNGPGRWTVDLTLAKNFRITEAAKLQLRADFFNALNHVNYSNPNTNFTSPDFGRITSAGGASGIFQLTSGGARTGQLGVRLSF